MDVLYIEMWIAEDVTCLQNRIVPHNNVILLFVLSYNDSTITDKKCMILSGSLFFVVEHIVIEDNGDNL